MRRLMLGCLLAVAFSVPVMADTTSASCFQNTLFGGLNVCPGAPLTNRPGSTFTLTERGFGANEVNELGRFFFDTTGPVTNGDIVLCENGVPCNQETPTRLWSDLLRIQNEGFRMRVDFFSDGPGVDFEGLRKTLSKNAQLINEPCCENEGETIIYRATTAFVRLRPVPVIELRTNTFVIESDPVPEPSSLLLMGSGLILLGRQLRRRKLNS